MVGEIFCTSRLDILDYAVGIGIIGFRCNITIIVYVVLWIVVRITTIKVIGVCPKLTNSSLLCTLKQQVIHAKIFIILTQSSCNQFAFWILFSIIV